MLNYVIGGILLVSAIFLVVSILLQSSKSHKLPGTIAGGAETFFGKTKGDKYSRILSKMTTVVAIVFCVLVIFMYVIQDQTVINYPDTEPTIPDTSNVVVKDTDEATDTDTTADTDANPVDSDSDTSAE